METSIALFGIGFFRRFFPPTTRSVIVLDTVVMGFISVDLLVELLLVLVTETVAAFAFVGLVVFLVSVFPFLLILI